MSFSSDVKKEIAGIEGEDRHCRIAELAAVINSCGSIRTKENDVLFSIQTDSVYVMERAVNNINKDFKYAVNFGDSKTKSNNLHIINLDNPEIAQKLLWAAGIMDMRTKTVDFHIDGMVTKSVCCKKSYIRSAFLCSGYISNPEKSYHLEFIFNSEDYANEFSGLINYFELNSKVISRKGSYVVYLKEGEHIVDLLNIIGAHKCLLQLENLRITKEIMNNINRKVNFQSANLNKTINASVKHVEDIEFISGLKGLDWLPRHLEELARLRLDYPELALKELGASLDVPISKSGINHRLKKISEIADELRTGMKQ